MNPASGAYHCTAGCKTVDILRSLGLPEQPNANGHAREEEPPWPEEEQSATSESQKEQQKLKVPEHWRWLDVAKIQDWNCPPLKALIDFMIMFGSFVFVAAQSQTGGRACSGSISQS